MKNVREVGQYGEFKFFLKRMQCIKVVSDISPSNQILVCDNLGINPIQKNCFSKKRVPTVRVVIEVEGLLVFTY